MFKNAIPFSIPVGLQVDVTALEEAAQAKPWQPCAPMSAASIGFVPALYRGAKTLVHASLGRVLIAVRIDERNVPPQAVMEEVDRRSAEILEREGRKLGRRQMADLKDDVRRDLLPRAFVKASITPVLIAPADGLMLVGTTSKSRCDEVTSFLQESLGVGVIPAKFMATNTLPTLVMTAWLRDGCPASLSLGDSCELRETGGGAVRVTRHDLRSDTVQHEIEAGKVCRRLAMTHTNVTEFTTQFVLDDALTLRGVRFDGLLSSMAAESAEDDAAYYDATFVIESETLLEIYGVLLGAMGGVLGAQAKGPAAAEG